MISIRGATTVELDTKEEVLKETEIMLKEIIEKNQLDIKDIISIIFTATKDISSVYPAVAARNLGLTKASLMCVQEMYVEGSLEKCIRVSVSAESKKSQADVKHVYLKGAESLRPDLT